MRTYNEQDILTMTDAGEDAGRILEDILPGTAKRYISACNTLKRVLADVRKTFPDAVLYTGGDGGLCLMLGNDHDDQGKAQQQLIAARSNIDIGDGAW